MGKQAVVIIHGVGEQVPMDTLRGFVDTVWTSDPGVCDPNAAQPNDRRPKAWSKPDDISGDFELRRITTNFNKNGDRTDFYEFYWAHLMRDTKLSAVWAWARVLLLRSPWRVPGNLLPVWGMLWTLMLGILAGALLLWKPTPAASVLGWSKDRIVLISLGLSGLWIALAWFLVYFAGDAARYLHVRPPNIDVRHAIRTAGVDLLTKLHESGRFDRIVVVGHSLGTVIGYDVLSYFWQACHTKLGVSHPQPTAALERLEVHARNAQQGGLSAKTYQDDQPAYFAELRKQHCPWLVTDFVTLGSPLAHAAVLMAKDRAQLVAKQHSRELPACPPYPENGTEFSFLNKSTATQCPDHGSLYAPTRWTNIYFPYRAFVFGDPIGGPVAPVFGPGVRDLEVRTRILGGLFSHTFYWKRKGIVPNADHIAALREALRIA